MKIMAWNLNHRTAVKPIPDGIISAIDQLAPDVVVLTEYVEREVRSDFRKALLSLGFVSLSVSEVREGHNQVLIASRDTHVISGIPAPLESHGSTNFLAVEFPEQDLALIGIRVPAYERAGELLAYERELVDILNGVANRRVLLIGDLNGDPHEKKSRGGKMFRDLIDHGWKIPRAEGDWSFLSGKGNSRIDHAVASQAVGAISARYVVEVDGVIVAGPGTVAISDHAILLCEIDGATDGSKDASQGA